MAAPGGSPASSGSRHDGQVKDDQRPVPDRRKAELAERLDEVRGRIGAACQAAGRSPHEVTLIAITKTFPASDVRLLSALGIRDVGENRDSEAAGKAAQCAALQPPPIWHFVGQLQTNKCASVVSYAAVVHSVDRLRLVRVLGTQARKADRGICCLVQVSLDGDAARGGAVAGQVPRIADAVAAEPGLVLGGVMAVAPLAGPPSAAFGSLAEIAAGVRAAHPEAIMISAGMSGDLEEAIAAGATHVRVGTALLGGRPASFR
jgi:pyridoxal phosphate enzyme (YggS family)